MSVCRLLVWLWSIGSVYVTNVICRWFRQTLRQRLLPWKLHWMCAIDSDIVPDFCSSSIDAKNSQMNWLQVSLQLAVIVLVMKVFSWSSSLSTGLFYFMVSAVLWLFSAVFGSGTDPIKLLILLSFLLGRSSSKSLRPRRFKSGSDFWYDIILSTSQPLALFHAEKCCHLVSSHSVWQWTHMHLLVPNLYSIRTFNNRISQNSVAMHLRCDAIFRDRLIVSQRKGFWVWPICGDDMDENTGCRVMIDSAADGCAMCRAGACRGLLCRVPVGTSHSKLYQRWEPHRIHQRQSENKRVLQFIQVNSELSNFVNSKAK